MRKTFARKPSRQNDIQDLSPDKTLPALAICRLRAYVDDGTLWLAVSTTVAKLLQDYAIGTSEGGPHTATETSCKLLALLPDPAQSDQQQDLVSVRLSSEEAIFLAQALGNVHFATTNCGPCSTEDLWSTCVKRTPSFAHSYIAYQHFRSKGWIPRSGLQYGTDLVLYEQHPSLVHSTVCVIIVPMSHAGVNHMDPGHMDQGPCDSRLVLDGQDGSLSWHDVEGINRLCIRVGKRLMLLYIQPQCVDMDLTTLACLDKFAVAERSVERWVPEASINLM